MSNEGLSEFRQTNTAGVGFLNTDQGFRYLDVRYACPEIRYFTTSLGSSPLRVGRRVSSKSSRVPFLAVCLFVFPSTPGWDGH